MRYYNADVKDVLLNLISDGYTVGKDAKLPLVFHLKKEIADGRVRRLVLQFDGRAGIVGPVDKSSTYFKYLAPAEDLKNTKLSKWDDLF